jgi:hypothetical protein
MKQNTAIMQFSAMVGNSNYEAKHGNCAIYSKWHEIKILKQKTAIMQLCQMARNSNCEAKHGNYAI